jgi:hypothetical protein
LGKGNSGFGGKTVQFSQTRAFFPEKGLIDFQTKRAGD